MLKDITIGQFFPGNSPIHRLDPRTKITVTFALIVVIFFIKSYAGYAVLAAFTLGVTLFSRIPVKYVLKGLKPLVLILALTFIINLFFTSGEHVLFRFWRIRITLEGLDQALTMALRLIFLITCTSILTLTTSPLSLTEGLELLMAPLKKIKFPSHELAMMMSIALRFIPTLIEEADKIMKSQMSRGADFESGNMFKRAKSLIPLLIPLFVSAFRRADELAMAMESRCYRGGEGRTRLKQLKYTKLDLVAILAAAAAYAAMVIV